MQVYACGYVNYVLVYVKVYNMYVCVSMYNYVLVGVFLIKCVVCVCVWAHESLCIYVGSVCLGVYVCMYVYFGYIL